MLSDPNLSRVAARFHITQSALSKRIKALEIELGFPLFERRGPKGLHPLPHAYHLAELIDQVSVTLKKGIEKINHGATSINSFSIIGPQLFIREVFLPWWSKYQENLPDPIELEVRIPALKIVSLETLKIQADAAIIEKKEELIDHICKKIFSEQWGIVRSHSAKNKKLKELKWGTYAKHSNPVDQFLNLLEQKLSRSSILLILLRLGTYL